MTNSFIHAFIQDNIYIVGLGFAIFVVIIIALRLLYVKSMQIQKLKYQLEMQQELSLTRHEQYEFAQKDLEHSQEQLKFQFENLAQSIFAQKGKEITQLNQSSLENLLRPLSEQVELFKNRVNQIHSESISNNASLNTEIKRVADMGIKISNDANNLSNALLGQKKVLGNWGEMQLEQSLQLFGMIKDQHYKAQPSFVDKNGQRNIPDFLIMLPDEKHLVIDSKVSLVDYNRAVAAKDDQEQGQALNAHIKAIKNHIKDLASKSYNQLEGINSPPFVLMYFPIEPAYIQALSHDQKLFEYGWNKQVVMVSHTTLLPVIKTISSLWAVANSNKQARLLGDQAGEIYNQVVLVSERLNRLGMSLSTASRQYNDTVTALVGQQGLASKVEKFAEVSTKAKNEIKQTNIQDVEIDSKRLQKFLTNY